MSVLTWWAIPVGATIVAIVAMYLINRPRRSDESQRSIREFQEFRSALRQRPGQHPGSRSAE